MALEQMDFAATESAAIEMKSAANAIRDILDDVQMAMNTVHTEEVWQGNTAEGVKAEFNRLRPSFDFAYEEIMSWYKEIMVDVEEIKKLA